MGVKSEVAQLYVAMFGRAPDAEGLSYWAGLRDSGKSMVQVADMMFATQPARTYFPAGLTHQQIVGSFYENVLGRVADSGGLAYWISRLDAAGSTPGSVIAEMIGVISTYAGTDPAGLNSAALFNNRAAAAQYYGEHNGSLAHATNVLSNVTGDLTTVFAARTLVLPAGASGTYDAGGFGDVSVGALGGHVSIRNVQPGTELAFSESTSKLTADSGDFRPMFNVRFELADASGRNDSVRLLLVSENTIQVGNLFFPGVEHLSVQGMDLDGTPHYNGVYLSSEFFQDIRISGNVSLEFGGGLWTTGFIDARDMAAGSYLWTSVQVGANGIAYGSPGDDTLHVGWWGGHVHGGPGDDSLQYGNDDPVLWGDSGADTFYFFPAATRTKYCTIGDFRPSEGDALDLWGLVNSFPPVWRSQKVALAPGAAFSEYLDACTAGAASNVSWFQHGGDTYLVVDNSEASTFQEGYMKDQIVKLMGQVDLSGLTVHDRLLG